METKKNKRELLMKTIKNTFYIIILIILWMVFMQKITNNNASFGGYRIFRILSESMVPEYSANDVILVKEKDYEDIKIGDDLVYLTYRKEIGNIVITHRVVGIEKDAYGNLSYYTKGLANINEDPIVSEKQVYGVVVHKIHTLSLISNIINNIYGFFLLVFIPIVILIFIKIKELI